jgi:hypothetical protein
VVATTGKPATARVGRRLGGADPDRRLGLAIAGHTKPSGRKDRPGADPRDHRLVPAMPRRADLGTGCCARGLYSSVVLAPDGGLGLGAAAPSYPPVQRRGRGPPRRDMNLLNRVGIFFGEVGSFQQPRHDRGPGVETVGVTKKLHASRK